MTDNVSIDSAPIDASRDPSPQSVWSLVVTTLVLYRRFWREFLQASGSVTAAIAVAVATSIAFGHDLREVDGVFFMLVLLGLYYLIALVATMAGQACQQGSISVVRAFRKSWVGFITSFAVVAAVVFAMVLVLLVPVAGTIVAVYILVRLSLAFEIAILEHLNPVTALRRAWTLTKRRFWRSLIEVVLPNGYLLIIALILALLPHFALDVLLAVVALPAFAIFRVLVYLDLLSRERQEPPPAPQQFA